MRKNQPLTLLVGLCLLLALTAFTQPITPAIALARFFTENEVQADWFAEDFLAQVPLAQIAALRQQVTDELGAFQRIEGAESPFTVSFAQGNAMGEITLDEAALIAGLRITPAQRATDPGASDLDITPQAALERLFTSAAIEEGWFSDDRYAPIAHRRSHLATITAPTVMVQGDTDPIVPVAAAEALADLIPNAELHLIAGLAHNTPDVLVPTFVAAITAAADRAANE